MTYAWTVIGAGPAGIAAVGKLLDLGVADKDIAWVDPSFAAGDLGAKWRSVSSNTKVATFLEYLHGAKAFRFSEAPPMPLTAGRMMPMTAAKPLVVWCRSRKLMPRRETFSASAARVIFNSPETVGAFGDHCG